MLNVLRHILSPMERDYQQRGYQVFRKVFPAEQITAVADMVRDLIIPYEGLIRRNNEQSEFNEFFPSSRLIKNALLNAHLTLPSGLEPLSAALRTLITSRALGERLYSLDGEEHYSIHQTILFMSAPTTGIHLDSWSIDTVPHGFSHTVWIPLQDMNTTSGAPSVIPWPKGKLVTEADLGLSGIGPPHERYERYHQALSDRLLDASPEAVTPLMRSGDFVVWSPLTPHFTLPSRPWPAERLALQILIRPTRYAWGNYFIQPPRWTIDRAVRVTDQFSLLVT